MKKLLFTIPIVLAMLWFLPLMARVPLIFQSPELAYADFQDTTDQAEDMLMDPLILSGEKVVPLIMEEIRSPEMKLRRYAIHFLGNGKYEQSIHVLKEILNNENEIDYFRGDALASIFNINPDLGVDEAMQYIKRKDYLGRQASNIVQGENSWWVQRSFWEALQNVHH